MGQSIWNCLLSDYTERPRLAQRNLMSTGGIQSSFVEDLPSKGAPFLTWIVAGTFFVLVGFGNCATATPAQNARQRTARKAILVDFVVGMSDFTLVRGRLSTRLADRTIALRLFAQHPTSQNP